MSVEMKLELGHRATMREKPTAEGFTHDWLVFVKGAEGSDIFFFVDKVVFHLHDSFPKPKRVVKEPPYEVAESGYAGFIIPIEVYFRNKEEPKKVRFEYDLFLSLESSPVNNIRREKLTFQNPSEDFRRKLLKARGIGSGSTVSSGTPSLQTQTSASIQHVDEPPRLAAVHTKSTPVAEKKIKSHSTGKEASHSSHSKPNKVLPPPSGPSGNANNKEPKSVSKASHSPEGKEPKGKSAKSDKEPKSVSKRSAPDGQNHHGPSEKKKRHHSNSDGSDKHADSNKTKETKEKKEKHKNKVSGHSSKKEKHKASAQSNTTNKDHITKSPSKSINSVKSVSPSRLSNEDSNDAKSALMHDDDEDNNSSPASDFGDAAETWCEISPDKMDISSGKDSISPMSPDIEQSPPPVVEKLRRNSNHDTEENEKDDKHSKSLKTEKSPMPKNSSKSKKSTIPINNHNNNSNNNSTNHRNAKQNGSVKEANQVSPPTTKAPAKPGKDTLEPTYLHELVDLQKKIMSLEDRNLLQRVVDLIEETGCYQVTSKSFDFDLCRLDQTTVRKLKQCLLL